MARRSNKHFRQPRPLGTGLARNATRKSDGDYIVQPVSGEKATKEYTCPGCLRKVMPGMAHVVVWPRTPPVGTTSGVEYRRHWHNPCWDRHR